MSCWVMLLIQSKLRYLGFVIVPSRRPVSVGPSALSFFRAFYHEVTNTSHRCMTEPPVSVALSNQKTLRSQTRRESAFHLPLQRYVFDFQKMVDRTQALPTVGCRKMLVEMSIRQKAYYRRTLDGKRTPLKADCSCSGDGRN